MLAGSSASTGSSAVVLLRVTMPAKISSGVPAGTVVFLAACTWNGSMLPAPSWSPCASTVPAGIRSPLANSTLPLLSVIAAVATQPPAGMGLVFGRNPHREGDGDRGR